MENVNARGFFMDMVHDVVKIWFGVTEDVKAEELGKPIIVMQMVGTR
jgi:hypothetical protein